MQILHKHFHQLVELAKKDEELTASHSIEEAEAEHARKKSVHERAKSSGRRRKKRRTEPTE